MKDSMRFVTRGLSEFNFLRTKTRAAACKGRSKSWLFVMLLVVLMAGCNGNTTLDSSPTVTITAPATDATGVAVNTNITAVFTETMKADTITAATFILKQGATAVTGTVTYVGLTATFDPTADLTANTTYTATITTDVKNSVGNAMTSNYTWSFTTGAASDTTAPTVTLTVPDASATGVAINTKVIAAFSEAMDPSTITATTFTLKQKTTDVPVPGTVSYSGNADFIPAINLLYNTVYTATVTTGVKDLVGNALASNYTWDFTTVAAGALSVSPATLTYGEQIVGTTSEIQIVTISNTGGTALTVSSITIEGPNKGDFVLDLDPPAIPFTINGGANQIFTVAFKPTAPAGDKIASISIASNAGNTTVFAIGTSVVPDTTEPTVSLTNPANGDTGVAIGTNISAAFSEEMDPFTFNNSTTFTLKQGTINILGNVTYSGLTATFNPDSSLSANTTYTATITTEAKDLAGNPLGSNYEWTFTTVTTAP